MIEVFYINGYNDGSRQYYDMLFVEDGLELVNFSGNGYLVWDDQSLVDSAIYKFDIWQSEVDEEGNPITKKLIDKIYIGYGSTARIIFG